MRIYVVVMCEGIAVALMIIFRWTNIHTRSYTVIILLAEFPNMVSDDSGPV